MTVWIVARCVLHEECVIEGVFATEKLARDTYPCSFDDERSWYDYMEWEVRT